MIHRSLSCLYISSRRGLGCGARMGVPRAEAQEPGGCFAHLAPQSFPPSFSNPQHQRPPFLIQTGVFSEGDKLVSLKLSDLSGRHGSLSDARSSRKSRLTEVSLTSGRNADLNPTHFRRVQTTVRQRKSVKADAENFVVVNHHESRTVQIQRLFVARGFVRFSGQGVCDCMPES